MDKTIQYFSPGIKLQNRLNKYSYCYFNMQQNLGRIHASTEKLMNKMHVLYKHSYFKLQNFSMK